MQTPGPRIRSALLLTLMTLLCLSLASSPVGCGGGYRDVPTVDVPTPTMPLPPPTITPTTEFQDEEKRPPDTAEPPHRTATAPQATMRPEVDTRPRDISDQEKTPSVITVTTGPHETEIKTVEELLEEGRPEGRPWKGLGGTHIAFRGVTTADSMRCHWTGRAIISLDTEDLWAFVTGSQEHDETPTRDEIEKILEPLINPTGEGPITREGAAIDHLLKGGYTEDVLQLLCYADYHVIEYILGTGPEKVTVAYGSVSTEAGWDIVKKDSAAVLYSDDKPLTQQEYEEQHLRPKEDAFWTKLAGPLHNRDTVVFLHPQAPVGNIAVETWSALAYWDVQKDEAGQLQAVRHGLRHHHSEYKQALEDLEGRITAAAAQDALAGKRLAGIADITDHYREMGAYGDITPYDGSDDTFTPAQPPPPDPAAARRPIPTPTPQPTRAALPTPVPTRTPVPPSLSPEDLRSTITFTAQ